MTFNFASCLHLDWPWPFSPQHPDKVYRQQSTAEYSALPISEVGSLSSMDLAREANAKAIIHTGDFGFFEATSIGRIHDRTLRHLIMYSPLIPSAQREYLLAPENPMRQSLTIFMLSEFPLLLSGQIKLQVPVFTVAGACEDILLLEKLRSGTYDIENLHLIIGATTRCLHIGRIKLRLLGLGGAFVTRKLFDNGEGEGVLASLALVLKADLTLSAGLHFRYTSSWNEFSVQGDYDTFRNKLRNGRDAFYQIWDSVKSQVDAVIDDHQRFLLDKALAVVDRIPLAIGQPALLGDPPGTEDAAFKNCWNWNLCDAEYGSLVLDIKEGRVSAELKSQGFDYAYRCPPMLTIEPTPT